MKKKIFNQIRNYYSEIYKVILFLISVVLIVSFFPREGKFKYEFREGKPWLHEDLIAPFDFAIRKPDDEIKKEKEAVLINIKPFFIYDHDSYILNRKQLINNFKKKWAVKYNESQANKPSFEKSKKILIEIYDSIYSSGVVSLDADIEKLSSSQGIYLIKDNVAEEKFLEQFFTISGADNYIRATVIKHKDIDPPLLISLLQEHLIQNIRFDQKKTQQEEEEALANISTTREMVQQGERIIAKGDVISNEKFLILESLKQNSLELQGSTYSVFAVLSGQIVLVSVAILVLGLFLLFFRKDVFDNNREIVLILLLMLIMVFVTSMVMKYQNQFLFLVPLCLVPVVMRVFFDSKLAVFVHVICIILIGFLVPNSFEFVFLQLIAGIVTIVSVRNLQKRSQFFLTSLNIFLTYSAIYVGLTLIQGGKLGSVQPMNFGMFAGSAILTMFAYPLIYGFEKMFGLVTNVTLMELSDTNNNLLRELSNKAPGTFQHSMQVANLAEEALLEIGGNSVLARTGALYHDIGKMDMPMYFIENQITDYNPHDELSNQESARTIINHISYGIELAKKHKLPEQIIDFIRTHHGTRKTEYFYKKELQTTENPDQIDEQIFMYHGPIPFSKETCVVMMADSVEAASRSLKIYDEDKVNYLVESIINSQLDNGQFANSDITMKDITRVKKMFKKKLMNIYHIRIEYPV